MCSNSFKAISIHSTCHSVTGLCLIFGYLQNQVSPAPQRKPALGPEADGELILAVPQGEGLIRDRHGKQQLLCCTFLQQHPGDNKKKPKKKQHQLVQRQQAVQSGYFFHKNLIRKLQKVLTHRL